MTITIAIHTDQVMSDNETVVALSRRIALESKVLDTLEPTILLRVTPPSRCNDEREATMTKIDADHVRVSLLDPSDHRWNHSVTCPDIYQDWSDYEVNDIVIGHLKRRSEGNNFDMKSLLGDRTIHHSERDLRSFVRFAMTLCLMSTFTPKR